jgi:hypothetical protein
MHCRSALLHLELWQRASVMLAVRQHRLEPSQAGGVRAHG